MHTIRFYFVVSVFLSIFGCPIFSVGLPLKLTKKQKNFCERPDPAKNMLTDKRNRLVPTGGKEDERFARYEGTYRGTDRNG